ncbi:MAG: BPTI/Kunitz-type proteinase inhibitor domain-containing protein [Saprospiraceae bacterium]
MQLYLLAFSSMMLILAAPCQRQSTPEVAKQPLHQNCALKPQAGPCRMAIKRYYYDPETKTCKEFLYGGCQGVVPFETLESCRKGCGCE